MKKLISALLSITTLFSVTPSTTHAAVPVPQAVLDRPAEKDTIIQPRIDALNKKLNTLADASKGMDEADTAIMKMMELSDAIDAGMVSAEEVNNQLGSLEALFISGTPDQTVLKAWNDKQITPIKK